MLTRYCSSDDGGSPGGAGRRAAKWAWAGTRAGGHVAPGAIVSTVSWRSVGTVRVAAHRRRRRQRARCAACGPSGAASAAPRGRRSSPSRPMWLGVRRFRPVIPGSQRAVRRSHGPNPRNGDQETRPRRRINWGVQGSNQAGRLRAEAGQCGSCSPQPINVAAVPRSRSTWQLFPAGRWKGEVRAKCTALAPSFSRAFARFSVVLAAANTVLQESARSVRISAWRAPLEARCRRFLSLSLSLCLFSIQKEKKRQNAPVKNDGRDRRRVT